MFKILIIPVVLFLIASRLFLLDLLPATLTHDEMVYAAQAYSYYIQGTSLNQLHSPFSLFPIEFMYAELPATIIYPGFLLSSNPLLASHLTSAIFGILLPFITSWLVYGLSRNKTLTIFIFLVSVFNPLLWQFSRFSVDVVFSIFFYLLGAAIMVNLPSKYKLLSIPVFFIGFFQYQGYKLVLVPFILLIILLQILSSNQDIKLKSVLDKFRQGYKRYEFIILIFAFLLSLIYAVFLLPNQPDSSRLQQTILTDTEYVGEIVNSERALTIPSPLTPLFVNKLNVMGEFVVKRLAGTFDPELLFINIEPAVSGFTVWTHGIFYWFDAVSIVVGLITILLFIKKKYLIGTITIFVALSLNVSNFINTGSEWFLLRGYILYVILSIISGIGLYKMWDVKRIRPIVVIIYFLSVINFAFHYFYRFPTNSLDWANFNERVIARYATLHQQSHPDISLTVYGNEPHYLLYSYLLYGNNLSESNKDNIANQLVANTGSAIKTYRSNNVIFTNDCAQIDRSGTVISSVDAVKCDVEIESQAPNLNNQQIINNFNKNQLSIPQVKDSGERFKINNDVICKDKAVSNYIILASLNQLNIEKQNESDFCKNWIADFGRTL